MTTLREAAQQALDSINELFAAEQSEGGERGRHIRTPATREHLVRVAQARRALHESCDTLRAALTQQDEPAQQTRKDGRYSVAYRCKCGHEQNVTEIVHGGRTYAGSGANWCDGCGDGPPVRVDAMQQQAEAVEGGA